MRTITSRDTDRYMDEIQRYIQELEDALEDEKTLTAELRDQVSELGDTLADHLEQFNGVSSEGCRILQTT